jgi:Fic family protein
MRSFQRRETLDPVPGSIVATLRRIDVAAGAEARYLDQLPQLLDALRESARVESITASNAIEGVVVDENRAQRLAAGEDPRPYNRSEAEFAGYTAALDYLHGADPGPLNVGLLLHLHRLLLSRTDGRGGYFKLDDNVVIDRHEGGTTSIRFTPVAAAETEFFVVELVERTKAAFADDIHPLLVIGAFALDLLCVHPFADGNGRVTRLITSRLLQQAGYGVGRYVSLEQLIFDTKNDYYASLAASTDGWFDDGRHTAWPWQTYFLARIADAYERFEQRIAAGLSGGTKQDRVRDYVLFQAPAQFTIADIRRALPGISDNTIRLVLVGLRDAGSITVDGTGRGAAWTRR